MIKISDKQKFIPIELLLVLTWFIGVMAIQFILPSLPTITEQLHATPQLTKLTISLFLFGKAIGMLAFGPLSDKYGRKLFMLIGLVLFTLGNIFAYFSTTITILLCARFIQGLGVSATVMIGRAMINDKYKNQKAALAFSHVFLAASLIIAFLPMLGSIISSQFNWHFAFIIMGIYSAGIFILYIFYLPETYQPQLNIALNLGQIFSYYKIITSNPLFLGYVLCSIFMIAGESAFNTASSFLLIKTYGLSKHTFGLLITCLAVGHLLGTFICGRLVKHYDLVKMMGTGVIILAASTSIMTLSIHLGYDSVTMIILPMILFYVGTGFVMTITAVGVTIPFPNLIGIASAASLSLNFSFSAASSALMSFLPTDTAIPVSLLIAACGIFSLLSWYSLILPNRMKKESLDAYAEHH